MRIRGPKEYVDPVPIRIGEVWEPQLTVRDGVASSTHPDGATVDISSATIDVLLRVFKPDGSTNAEQSITKTVPASGVGKFALDTATWKEGTYGWEFEYVDTAPTPDTKVVLAVGTVKVRKKPSAGG